MSRLLSQDRVRSGCRYQKLDPGGTVSGLTGTSAERHCLNPVT